MVLPGRSTTVTMRRHTQRKTAAPPGAWLAFLALAVQVFLPFLVAYEIELAGTAANAETITICHTAGTSTAPGQDRGDTSHHGISECCPLCTTVAADHAFIATAPAAPPLPYGAHYRSFSAHNATGTSSIVATPYQSRAPPSSV
jgi:hypothetical protein